MVLSAGTRLGRYEIVGPIGAGGMGEVYRAHDIQLERTVAIKVLGEDIARDARFRERFDREARTIARLSHPHICTLHDVVDHDGRTCLIMEYVDGESLAARLERCGQLDVDKALTLGVQLLDALDHAHRHGVVHRDLKPGNVMVTASGVKLLDFGLAKTPPDDVATAQTRTALATTPGAVIGTLPYMAPEQVEGRPVDARTDIFAFGCVLYEALTGRRPFSGDTPAALLGAILRDAPPSIGAVVPGVPPTLERVVRTCLAKDPYQRWQTAADLRRQLSWISEEAERPAAAHNPGMSTVRKRWPWMAAGAVAAMGIAGSLMPPVDIGRAADGPVTRSVINVEPGLNLLGGSIFDRILFNRPSTTAIALSADGRALAYVAAGSGPSQLYLRHLDAAQAARIPNSDGAETPFFSPDGSWLAFWSNGALRKVPRTGGTPVAICQTERVTGADWLEDDTIVFAGLRTPILRVAASGGTATAITALDESANEISHSLPRGVTDSRVVLYTATKAPYRWTDATINALNVATGQRTTVYTGASDARFIPPEYLLVAQAGTILALPFDVDRLEVTGGPVAVLNDVMHSVNGTNTSVDIGAAQLTVASNGTMAYVPGGVVPEVERSLAWVDRTGRVEPIPSTSLPFQAPRLSRDGRRIAVATQRTMKSPSRDIWVYDVAGRAMTRIASGENAWTTWTPDGRRVTFTSLVGGVPQLFWAPADGSGPAEPLLQNGRYHAPGDWTPDGRTLLYVQDNEQNNRDLWTLTLPERAAAPLIATPFNEAWPSLSPDGKWLAYSSDETGQMEVYVRSFPSLGEKRRVSTRTGIGALWARDGRTLYYMETSDVAVNIAFAVDVRTSPSFSSGEPRKLFDATDLGGGNPARMWDAAPDGRFLMASMKRVRTPVTQIELVQHWFAELRERVSVGTSPTSSR